MDIEDVIYFEQLYKRLNGWDRGSVNALIGNKIGGYTAKEISCIPEVFGLSRYCRTSTRVRSAMHRGVQAIQTEHKIEKHWGRV